MVFTKLTLADGAQYAVDGVVTGMQASTKSNVGREVLGTVAGALVGNIIVKSVFHASGGAGSFLGPAGGYLIASNMKENMTVPSDSVVRVTPKSVRHRRPVNAVGPPLTPGGSTIAGTLFDEYITDAATEEPRAISENPGCFRDS